MNGPSFRTRYLKLRSVLHDRNTGLPAFPLMFDRLRTALDARRRVGVLHVELANLQLVESLYGWQALDRIVAVVARLLREAIGEELPGESMLALNGVAGDRFVLFLPQRDDGGEPDAVWLGKLSQEIGHKLDAVFDAEEFAGLGPEICARVGCALLTDNPFYRFERCVYAAVDEARGAPERRERRRELSWGEELDRIIRAESVETVFQPILELDGGEVLGYEAYVRGPSGSMFESPRAMFALSGRVGVSGDLDHLCCEHAVRDFAREIGEGKLFVNVLADHLDDDSWREERLRAAMNNAGLEPAAVVLEFSEHGGRTGDDSFCRGVERLRREGFGVAIDDVGTGRTEEAEIERLQPDYLKLDSSLVRNIHDNLIRQEVLVTLSRLAERLGSAVIAEGVETREEAAAVVECGARYAQGFFFAQPSGRRFERDGAPLTRRRGTTGPVKRA
jgi:EAL domain-containing protein (putative c-di-GMP-specific phosphodiesterase class I)/GGDEF domain-containing protein